MAITIQKAVLWRAEVPNQTGELHRVLAPLADAGANLRVVMGYRFPGDETRAAIELFPVRGQRQTQAAEGVGLRPSEIPCLIVEGDDRPGLGRDMSRGIADAGVNLAFLMAQTVGRRFSAVLGFGNAEDMDKAAKAIRAAAKPPKGAPAGRAKKRRAR